MAELTALVVGASRGLGLGLVKELVGRGWNVIATLRSPGTASGLSRFRRMKTLQKFSSVHASVHNHFSQERHLISRKIYKERRAAALAA